jgi:hypothetical protein
MCTILTFTHAMLDDKMYSRIIDDMQYNSDGFSLLLTDELGQVSTNLRTMSQDAVIGALGSKFSRAFLHCRMATQGAPKLDNVHGWSTKGVYVHHNGMISDNEARKYPVDSMMILTKLADGIKATLTWLQTQPYANVILIDSKSGHYIMSRSTVGTLYTDNEGNYSTNKIGFIQIPVKEQSVKAHEIEQLVFDDEENYDMYGPRVISITGAPLLQKQLPQAWLHNKKRMY